MRTRPIVALLLCAAVLFVVPRTQEAQAQSVRLEAGGGWAIPSTTLTVEDTEGQPTARVNPGSGPNAYAAAGLVWTLSENFSLEARLRAQQSQLQVDGEDVASPVCGGECELRNNPDGNLRAATVEGQLTLTSVGRVNPYFLVGLGVAQTTIDATTLIPPNGNERRLAEVDVTDAGGDVGFGATTRIAGGLFVTAEARVTGSLPGAKDNAVTTFPFTLGLSYTFGGQ